MGRKGSANLQVITDNFVKDQNRRRNGQPSSARVPTTPVKPTQRKPSSPDIELTSSPNKKIEEKEKLFLTIPAGPRSAIPKGSGPRSGLPLNNGPKSAIPKSNVPKLRVQTLVSAGAKVSGPKTPKTPLSASAKKNPNLTLQPPTSAVPDFDFDAPDTPVNVIYANAFFDNKTREDEETQAINKKVLKQQRKENIRNMRRERMKQPKDIRVALILGRLYDASHYELGPLSYWSDPEIENNTELFPVNEETDDSANEVKPKKMIPLSEVEVDDETEEEKKEKEEKDIARINHDKTNNVNAHPAWVPEEAGSSVIACQKTTTRINGKLVKKNKKPYVAIASIFAKLYDPIAMKKREEEEKLKLLERQKQNSIITELKPMGKSINSRTQDQSQNYNRHNNYNGNEYYSKNQRGQNYYQNRSNYNYNGYKSYNNNPNNQIYFRSQQQPNVNGNYYNKRNNNQFNQFNQTYNNNYNYGYQHSGGYNPYYNQNISQNYGNMEYNNKNYGSVEYGNNNNYGTVEYNNNNYGTNYGQNYTTGSSNNYYYSSYNGSSGFNQNRFKPRMNYQNNNKNNNNKNTNTETYINRTYENQVNIKS